jgi:hypothetical protein
VGATGETTWGEAVVGGCTDDSGSMGSSSGGKSNDETLGNVTLLKRRWDVEL